MQAQGGMGVSGNFTWLLTVTLVTVQLSSGLLPPVIKCWMIIITPAIDLPGEFVIEIQNRNPHLIFHHGGGYILDPLGGSRGEGVGGLPPLDQSFIFVSQFENSHGPAFSCILTTPFKNSWIRLSLSGGFYALSASKAIFRARTYNCITYSVR